MKKTLSLLIAAVLLLCAIASCSSGTPAGTDAPTEAVTLDTSDTPGEAATTADVTTAEITTALITEAATTAEETKAEPVKFNLADAPFRIINSQATGTSDTLSTVTTAFLTRLKAMTQLKYTMSLDTAAADGDGVAEIVIGRANRTAAQDLYNSLGPLDWSVSVVGNKVLLVGGSPDATAKAMNWLMMNYLVKNKTDFTEGELNRFVSDLKMPEIPVLPEANYAQLKNLTVYAIGDSYFAGEGLDPKKAVWPALMATKYSQTFENYGKGGSTVSDYITTNTPMCQRISDMKAGNPDIVLFEGGANDWNHNIPLGEAGSKDTKTFRGAVASCIEQLHAKYPNALIVCISNWEYGKANTAKVQTTAFAQAFCEVAATYSYTLPVNAADTSLIPAFVTNELFRTKYCIKSTDYNHLNADGMKMIMPFFEKIIAEGYANFKK